MSNHVWVSDCMWGCLWSSKENIRSPGTVVTGDCDPPEVGAGNELMSSVREVCTLMGLSHRSSP